MLNECFSDVREGLESMKYTGIHYLTFISFDNIKKELISITSSSSLKISRKD